jgi:hypothetical protein
VLCRKIRTKERLAFQFGSDTLALSEILVVSCIEEPCSPAKAGSPQCSDKLQGMFCPTAVLRGDHKEVGYS